MSDPVFALDVNFDSLAEMADFPPGFRDPCFTVVWDRIAGLAHRYGFALTVDVVARDLESEGNAERVREWAAAGVEIGNHSYGHPVHLGSMAPAAIREEIARAHERIAEVTGVAPTGFIAPNWSISRATVDALIELGYTHDRSLFSSLWLYPLVAKLVLNHLRKPARIPRYLDRRDWTFPLTQPRTPYLVGRGMRRVRPDEAGESLLVMPMPTTARWRPPVWHTLGFVLGRERLAAELRTLLGRRESFYYVMHPADWIDPAEVPAGLRHGFERLGVPLGEKLDRAEEVFELLAGSGHRSVTVGELAARQRAALGSAGSPARAVAARDRDGSGTHA